MRFKTKYIVNFAVGFFLMSIVQSYQLPRDVYTELEGMTETQQVDLLADKCWKNREKNPELAVICGEEALEIADRIGYKEKLGILNNYLGAIQLHYLHDIQTALPHMHAAVKYSVEYGDLETEAYAYNNLADAFFLTGNTPLAREFTNRSLSIFNSLNHVSGIAYGYINLGYIEREENNFEIALKHFTNAIELRRSYNDELGIASALLEIAVNYSDWGKLDSAQFFFNQSYQKQSIMDNKTWMAYALNGMAKTAYQTGNFRIAERYYYEALENNYNRKHYFGMIDSYNGLALIRSRFMDRDQGLIELKKAMDLALQVKSGSKILECYGTQTEFFINLGDMSAVLESYNNYIHAYDSVYTRQQYETMKELESRFSTESQLRETELALDYQVKQKLYIVALTLMFGILLALFIWQYYSTRSINRKLTSSIATRDLLMSIISHDLKGNIGTTKVYLESLLNDIEMFNKDEMSEILALMKDSATNTYSMLENLLQWAQDSQSGLTVNPESLHLNQEIQTVIEELQPNVDLKNQKLTIEIDPSIEVFSDRNLLHAVIRNLLSNAIKFTYEEGKIRIYASQASPRITAVSVEDNGVGIPKQFQTDLFSISNRYYKEGTSGEKSSRFGLNLINKFVKNWGGEIYLVSEPKKGTTITFTIPNTKL